MTRPDEHESGLSPGEPYGSPRRGGEDERGGPAALLLAISGLVLSVLLAPLGLLLDVAAIVVGARTLRRARSAPAALAGIIVGSVGAVLAAVVLTVFGVFWQEIGAYRDCMSGANTIATEEQCRAEFQRAVETRLGLTR